MSLFGLCTCESRALIRVIGVLWKLAQITITCGNALRDTFRACQIDMWVFVSEVEANTTYPLSTLR